MAAGNGACAAAEKTQRSDRIAWECVVFAESGYILYSTSNTTIRIDFSADDIAVWDGIDLDGLLEESVKQLAA